MKTAALLAKNNEMTVDCELLLEIIDMREEFQKSAEGPGAIANLDSYT